MRKMKFIPFFVLAGIVFQGFAAEKLTLVENGKTQYNIRYSRSASPIDRFAVEELQKHLKGSTGITFSAGSGEISGKTIFVGLSKEAAAILGKDSHIASLQNQDTIIQSKKGHLFLYGKGRHGNLYAVYEFLENELGCRWLSGFGGGDFIPAKKNVYFSGKLRKTHYAIPRRSLMNWFYTDKDTVRLYAYRNRQNILLNIGTPHKGICQDVDLVGPGCHILSVILPGFKSRVANKASSLFKVKDYFAIHPEWFSMTKEGKRVNNRQACFSNKELRKELEKNLFIFYGNQEKRAGRKSFYTLDLNDIAYNMCYCNACQALQKKYQTPGGSFFDFLLELCRKHPETEFATLAYQRSLTQIPPSGVRNPPGNLTIIFAPINGAFSGTLDKENRVDRKDLENWLKITPKVWVWYYPNTYASKLPVPAPSSNFERLAADIRTMAQLKVDGTYFEHDAGGASTGTNLSEMQSFVMYKLFRDPSLDEKELMKDFASSYYGKAAGKVLQFANELEMEWKNFVKKGGIWYYSFQNYPYLTRKNLLHWNRLMDEAAKLIAPEKELRIRLLRMGLDCVIADTLWDDRENAGIVAEAKSRILQTGKDIEKFHKRPMVRSVTKFVQNINARIPSKPIPEELLKKYPKEDIYTVLPRRQGKGQLKDKDANQGFALFETWDGKTFSVGTYSSSTKKYGPGMRLYAEKVVKDKYALYKLPKTTVLTPDMVLWGGKWSMIMLLGKDHCRLDDPRSLEQKWEIYVSLKFTADKVCLDRGFLVKVK